MAMEDDGVGLDMVGAITTEVQQQKQDAEIAEFEAMLKKKKKKKKKKTSKPKPSVSESDDAKLLNNGTNDNDADESEANSEDLLAMQQSYWNQDDTRDYPYTVLLDRIFAQLTKQNPDLLDQQKCVFPPPTVALYGTRRTGWGNFNEICGKLSRNVEHVKLFFLTEMNTTGNFDGNDSFILKGRWRPKQIESLLRKYIREYVTCNNCRSPKTTMEKDNSTRLYFLTCDMCGASRSVAPIKAGYHATTRDDRRQARNAAR